VEQTKFAEMENVDVLMDTFLTANMMAATEQLVDANQSMVENVSPTTHARVMKSVHQLMMLWILNASAHLNGDLLTALE